MERPGLALAALLLPAAVLLRWGAPQADSVVEKPPQRSAERPAAPRPAVVPRADWGADESMVREKPVHMQRVKAVFLHHTDHDNGYDCADVPRLLRFLEADHIRYEGWDDVGYNYLVDRCGTVYEGRAGGGEHAVRGAHTKGFNKRTVGIAALGTFDAGTHVPQPMLDAIAALIAWRLPPENDPHGRVRLTSTNDASRYPKGSTRWFDVIAGHRDAFETTCPGDALEAQLPELRDEVARLR
ncbi:peptidoglycan recognition protein [Streptomyces sp. TR02-1]|uniref:peptidoglycan recognition protein family protein n=1 Tax=Streptomyces sp. TR02-1 TaxID=3385977 RepID=UPI0039A27472